MSQTTHNAAQWKRTKQIVADALELPAAQRHAFVDQVCVDDGALRSEVLDLLRSFDTAGDMLSEHGVPARTLADALTPTAIAPGVKIGRYEIGSMLGTGGMGAVFEAFDTALQRPVALKLLSIGFSSTGARRRFDAEAAALARLDHPCVARVLEVGVHHSASTTTGELASALSIPYFAMELVRGARTIDKYIRDSGTSLRGVLALFVRVCEAIHHGHQKSVLHRDIKPRNILVDEQGNPKVIDFGVSRLLDSNNASNVTQAHDIVGTPAYMPPEAFLNGVHSLDTRADVYSLGITLYELLLGQPAFDTSSLAAPDVGKVIIAKSPALLGSVRDDCRGDVETVVAKAIARDPADRYQSADQFAEDLRRVLAYEPIIAKPTPLWKQARLFAKRHNKLMLGAAAIALALSLGVAGLASGLARARESERIAKEQATRAMQISDFMVNMIQSGSPFGPSSYTDSSSVKFSSDKARLPWPRADSDTRVQSVGDLLYISFNQLEASFPDDPKLRADLGAMLAQTSLNLTDPRASQIAERAEQMLASAYGENDTRTIAAKIIRFHQAVLDGTYSNQGEIEKTIHFLIDRNNLEERPLLLHLCSTYAACCRNSQKPEAGIALLNKARAMFDSFEPSDDSYKVNLDLLILQSQPASVPRSQNIAAAETLYARASQLPAQAELTSQSVLFHVMILQRDNDQLEAAVDTGLKGLAESTALFGEGNIATYEWYHHLILHSMLVNDDATAEYFAREQAVSSLTSLGPTSTYTTKAQGRVARILLATNKDLADAQRAARAAIDGAPEALARCEWWAVYHELLWAWAIRAQGNPQRASTIIRDRMTIEAVESLHPQGDWGQVIRWTQLAECEMDIASHDPSHSLDEAAWCVHEAVCYAEYLGRDWPSTKFAYKAEDRLADMLRAREKEPPQIRPRHSK